MQYSNARYSLVLCDSFGNPVGELNVADVNQFVSFSAVRSVGTVGAITITFSGGSQQPAFLPLLQRFGALRKDSIIEVWRTTGNIKSLLLDTVWYVRTIAQSLSQGGVITMKVVAFDNLFLLSGRLCLNNSTPQQNQLVYTLGIDNLMATLVYENTRTSPYFGPHRRIPNLIVPQLAFNAGETISLDVSKANLLETLQQLMQTSIMQGTPIYYDIESSSASSHIFQIYTNQRGVDRRSGISGGDGRSAVISTTSGVIRELIVIADWTDEVTAALPWGNNGASVSRFVTDPINQVTAYTTPYSWREAVSEAGNNNTTSADILAYALLQEKRGTWNVSATLQDTSDFLFGRDWGYGDRINIDAFGSILDTRINSIEITMENKQENIRIALAVTEQTI